MKHFILYFSILLIFSIPNNSQAQQLTGLDFATENANWWRFGLEFDMLWEDQYVNHAFVNGDTLINGKNAQVIVSEHHKLHIPKDPQAPPSLYSSEGPSLITYSTEDTVFFYNEVFNKFTPLYVFNVEEGDTFCLPVVNRSDLRPNPIANGDTCFCLVLDSVRVVPYDEVFLETYFVSSITGEDDGYKYPWPVYNWGSSTVVPNYPTGKYTKITGGLFSFLPNRNDPLDPNRPTDTDTLSHTLHGIVCYQDDSFDIHIPHSKYMNRCDFDLSLNIQGASTEDNSINIYPNPAKDHITIEISKPLFAPATLTISDITGRILQKTQLNNYTQKQRIKLHPLPAGQYILQITNEQNRWNQKLIIQQ